MLEQGWKSHVEALRNAIKFVSNYTIWKAELEKTN